MTTPPADTPPPDPTTEQPDRDSFIVSSYTSRMTHLNPNDPTDAKLSCLMEIANDCHRSYEARQRTALPYAKVAGEALLESRRLKGRGEWIPYLASEFKGSVRTAQRYMRIATNWKKLYARLQANPDLSANEALDALSTKHDPLIDPPRLPKQRPRRDGDTQEEDETIATEEAETIATEEAVAVSKLREWIGDEFRCLSRAQLIWLVQYSKDAWDDLWHQLRGKLRLSRLVGDELHDVWIPGPLTKYEQAREELDNVPDTDRDEAWHAKLTDLDAKFRASVMEVVLKVQKYGPLSDLETATVLDLMGCDLDTDSLPPDILNDLRPWMLSPGEKYTDPLRWALVMHLEGVLRQRGGEDDEDPNP